MKVFLDTNIPMYASGKEHKYKKSCQDIILSVASGRLTAYTDVEVFQEILQRFYYIKEINVGHFLLNSFLGFQNHFGLHILLRYLREQEHEVKIYKICEAFHNNRSLPQLLGAFFLMQQSYSQTYSNLYF